MASLLQMLLTWSLASGTSCPLELCWTWHGGESPTPACSARHSICYWGMLLAMPDLVYGADWSADQSLVSQAHGNLPGIDSRMHFCLI